MENINMEAQSMIVAVTVGGALLFGAMRLFGFGSSTDSKVAEAATTGSKQASNELKSKKQKKKSKKKKKVAADVPKSSEPKEVEAPVKPSSDKKSKRSTSKTSAKSATKSKATKVVEVTKKKDEVADPADSTDGEKKKKKKKRSRKKKQQPKQEEEVDSDEDDDEVAKTLTEKAKATVSVPKRAADFVNPEYQSQEEDLLDGWETVPVKTRKKRTEEDVLAKNLSSGNKAASGGEGKTKKKMAREVVKIEEEHVRVVLGEAGSTVSNIESMSGAAVRVNRDQLTCTITGDEEGVAVAKQLITSVISNQAKHTITLTSRLDKAILSKSGTNQNIRELSGAKIDYAFGKGKEDPMTVLITGEKEAVDTAKQLVEDYLQGKTPEGDDGIKRIKVTGFQGRILIGQKGAQITQMQKESGASINIEFIENGREALVSVIGEPTQIESGMEAIRTFLRYHNFSTSVELSPEARPGVMSQLNVLRKQIPNLKVDLNDMKTEILLTGSESGLKAGRSTLIAWIEKELGPPELKEGEVMKKLDLGSAAGKVIGKNRSMLDRLEKNASGARVKIKQGTICYAYGAPKAVQKLASEIEEIIAKHDEVLAKSQQEQAELQAASWVVLGSEEESQMKEQTTNTNVAPETDWGGFKLAQLQTW